MSLSVKPPPLLSCIVLNTDNSPALAGICAGFEAGKWRYAQLAEHIIEWLPEFALNEKEFNSIDGGNSRKALRQAAETIYTSEKYESRGEVGEILLHAIIRQQFGSEALISKIFFKDTPNETVKGFDAVHVVEAVSGLQLWLGEVKLYQSIKAAIYAVIPELQKHTEIPYMRREFAAICRKVDSDSKYKEVIAKLLDPNTSMDQIFERICIPVLLAYDCEVLAKHSQTDEAYLKEITLEFENNYSKFVEAGLPEKIEVILILFPMNSKNLLVDTFDKKLKGILA